MESRETARDRGTTINLLGRWKGHGIMMAEPSGKQQSARPRAQPWTAADDRRLAELVAR